MSAVPHAPARLPSVNGESASRDVDELAWPPSSDDLDCIEVVSVSAPVTQLRRDPSRTRGPTPTAPTLPSVPRLPGLVAVHDLCEMDADADTFRSEADHGASVGLRRTADRGRSWTRLGLYAAASVVVLTTMYPFVWRPPVSPELPQIAASSHAPPPAAPPPAAATAPVPEVARATPPDAAPRDAALRASAPVAPPAPPAATPREPEPFVSPPESQQVFQPDAEPARPVETMTRSTVQHVVPSGAVPTPDMAPRPTPAPPVTPVPPPTPVPERTDEAGVQAALQRYASAYSRLDARAAQAVWPSVDARALERAFEGLESQSLALDRCELDVGQTLATADCRGTATYVRRIGSKAPRTEPRAWTFNLRKSGDSWHILSAAAR